MKAGDTERYAPVPDDGTGVVAFTRQDELARLATAALQRGEALVAAGDSAGARRWFERAVRLAPADPAAAMGLAGLLLSFGDSGAEALFERTARACDAREAWLGLAASALRAHHLDVAVAAMRNVLTRFVMPEGAAGLADLIARAANWPGWCAVSAQAGSDELMLLGGGGVAKVDGKRLHGRLVPVTARLLTVTIGGTDVLGSPVDLARMRRVDGVVAARNGGLRGWAWCRSNPDAVVPLLVSDAAGRSLRVTARDLAMASGPALARPRGFAVSKTALRRLRGMLRVTGPDGRQLPGSPIDPLLALEAVPVRPFVASASAPPALRRPIAVVVPVFGGLDQTTACLARVLASVPKGTRVIVVDDATPDPKLAWALDRLAGQGHIVLVRHDQNLGFPAAANAGLRAVWAMTPAHDAVLLNSDTLVPMHAGVPVHAGQSWLARLRAAVHGSGDIGTATPLSNNAGILSYPARDAANAMPDAGLDFLAARTLPGVTVDIPTAIGFCMYIRRECAEAVGLLRTEPFAQGYGEENDFCLRARALGWRHVAVPGIVVGHEGGVSFGAARMALQARNLAVLEQLHPGYRALVAEYCGGHPALDVLAGARRALDVARWDHTRRDTAVALVTHDQGGGVARVVRARIDAHRQSGKRPIVLQPVADPDGETTLPGLCRVDDGSGTYPNLIYRLPGELPALEALLRAAGVERVEWHHRLGHDPSLTGLGDRLGVPTEFWQHDYAAICPRLVLLGPAGRYCGEPDLAGCAACVAEAGDSSGESLSVAELRARSVVEFSAADRVVVPSVDMAARLRRYIPGLRAVVERPEPDDVPVPPALLVTPLRRVAVIGAIGVAKGFDVLLACALDASRRRLPLEFIIAGHSIDDDSLFATGRVFVTGQYDEAEGEAMIRAQACQLAFLPTIVPETWGFTLGLAWRAGLRAAVFDIGAMAARVRASGYGWVLPLGLPPAMINNFLMAPRS